MLLKEISPQVLYAEPAIRVLGPEDINLLIEKAQSLPGGVCRICLHRSPDDLLHEMLIAKRKDSTYPPHRHRAAEESHLILHGCVTLILFSETGAVRERIPLGEPGSGRAVYARIPAGVYHDIVVESDMYVDMETKIGPFDPDDNEMAPWS